MMTQASDDLIWTLINNGFCSFKAKTPTQNFCRNEHNVTGLCNRLSCPLGNSRYATVVEDEGKLVLHVKTAERQHLPSQLWEKKILSFNMETALAEIDYELKHWSYWIRNKVKQRFLKMTQSLIRMRKLKKKPHVKVYRVNKKRERQEKVREEKAEKIANIEKKITQELLERLKQGTYDDIYNFKKETWNEVLNEQELSEEEEEEEFYADDYEEGEENYDGQNYGDDDEDDDEDDDDDAEGFYEDDDDEDEDDEGSEGQDKDENFDKDLEDLDSFMKGSFDSSLFAVGGEPTQEQEKKTKT
jgi:protein MAK16